MEKKEVKNNISPFKTMLQEDIDIFINIDEMGETIDIEGKQYKGVIENINKDFTEIEDIYSAIDVIIYLKSEEFVMPKRVVGKRIKINRTYYIVNNWYEEEGITILKLKEYQGY